MEAVKMFMLYAALLTTATTAMVAAKCTITPPKECDTNSPKNVVQSAQVNGTCDNTTTPETPIFVVGESYEVKLNFKPLKDAKFAKTVLKAKYGPFVMPLKVDDPDACKGKGLTCPLKADTSYTFTDDFTVPTSPHIYEPIRITLLWSLVNKAPSSEGEDNDNNNDGKNDGDLIFCVQIPALFKPKPTTTAPPRAVSLDGEPDFRVVH
ncbi:ecdysteroid-regulated 16 kDa protein-like [Babylonia areolata]|uniref:ecdysteroid-regulated 16 kDa protein-like n=1 Tax=Babylonia areolata TaxID=304850 RepID=UPI003FD05E8B